MSKNTITLRTKTKNGVTTVSVMMRHVMETGRRKDSISNALIARHHIEQIICHVNGQEVMSADIGAGISTNPFLSFRLDALAVGDLLSVSWRDNLGQSDSFETEIKSPAE